VAQVIQLDLRARLVVQLTCLPVGRTEQKKSAAANSQQSLPRHSGLNARYRLTTIFPVVLADAVDRALAATEDVVPDVATASTEFIAGEG
jgi:hypothetical protein